VRDEFTKKIADELAKAVCYRCSSPDCRRPTAAASESQDEITILGEAAHICAASPGGPRYDPTQTPEERKSKDNGIWLCRLHARVVDRDETTYTVKLLKEWKRSAQERAFREMVAPESPAQTEEIARVRSEIDAADQAAATPEFDEIFARLRKAAASDLAAFKRLAIWTKNATLLTLTLASDNSIPPFQIRNLPRAFAAAPEVTIVAPPGTGKTTTLLQLADFTLREDKLIAVFFRLGDWAAGSVRLLSSLRDRTAFRGISDDDVVAAASRGRLLLLLDGWNEIDQAARTRLRIEIEQIRREFPDVRIVATTRQQMLDVPISGPRVIVQPLSKGQQLDIARGYGEAGERSLDAAWRESGVRELVAIPLYLKVLVADTSGSASLPTTKEALLRLFVEQHERDGGHSETLNALLSGKHREILTSIAGRMTAAGSTALSDSEARSAIATELDRQRQAGQIASLPEPSAVIDTLVSHHALVRTGADGQTVSFQHQQFQEWYASREVERLMRRRADGDANAREQLRVEIFNNPAWEESILFAVERISGKTGGAPIVADSVLTALSVDPMLSAEMIYRSPDFVWQIVQKDISEFVTRWHKPGRPDRAVRFMIITGRPEFAGQIWPLASSADSQIQLPTLRTAPRFRPSVLGSDLASKVKGLADEPREHLLALIASESGMDGMDLATDLAIADPSPKIQAEVVQYLQFRRADRHVARLLANAHEATWALVARRGYADEISDEKTAERLRAERGKLIQNTTSPPERLGFLLELPDSDATRDARIIEAIADPTFPVKDHGAGSQIYYARQRAPAAVLAGLQRRVEIGLELPHLSEELLSQLSPVDDGPIARAVLDLDTDRRAFDVRSQLVGPRTVGELLDQFADCAVALRQDRQNRALSEQYRKLRERIDGTRDNLFVTALLEYGDRSEIAVVAALADVTASHGDSEDRNSPLSVEPTNVERVVAMLRSWVKVVTKAPDARRYELAEVAQAIGRFGLPALAPELKILLDEDRASLTRAREGFREAQRRGDIEATSDARTIYFNQYQDAFIRIGGEATTQIAIDYLEDPMFGFEASLIVKATHEKVTTTAPPSPLRHWPYFEDVAASRRARAEGRLPTKPTRAETAIFKAIGGLAKSDDKDRQSLAIKLGRVALAMPHTNRDKEIDELIALPQPTSAKRELLAAMALDGRVLDEKLIMREIDAWLEDAQKDETKAWHKGQNTWEIEPWLELLPFTDRPGSVIDGVTKVKAFYGTGHPQKWERVVEAVANVPGPVGESLLRELATTHRDVADDYTWTKRILSRDTSSAVLLCIDLFVVEPQGRRSSTMDAWSLARELIPYFERFPELTSKLGKHYRGAAVGRGKDLLERLIVEVGDTDQLIELINGYIATSRRFDGLIANALRETTLIRRPVPETQNAFSIGPVSVAKLRKFLFGLLHGPPEAAGFARSCLTTIDELRDHYGIPSGDPRHPDIDSGKAWPPEAEALKTA
jgi:NACHT C-terminal Alpha/Beta 2